MLIYAKILKSSNHLDIFSGGCLNACSIKPVNIFNIKQKFCILEQNIDFRFCKQTLNEQQCLMCNMGNTHKNTSLSVGILQFCINQSMCSHFSTLFLLRPCLRQQENALLQKGI